MKKVFKFMGIIAAAAMTLVACNKEVGPQEQIPEGGYKYSFSILEDDTKAEIGDNSIVWVDGDQVGLIVGDYAGAGDVDVNVSPREVNFSSETAIAAGTMAYAYFPFDKDNDDASATTITLSDVQEGAGVSAMPLAGIPFEIQNAVAGNDNTNGAIKFLNLGSLINFKIFSTDEDLQSETISSVTFDADGDIAGSALIDLTAIDAANASSLAVVVVDGLTSVTVEQEESIPADKDDATPVKMVIFPGTFSGTVTVTTDVATYTKEIPSREFVRSGSRTFGLDLAKAEREESVEPKFVKVTSDEELTSGNYLIVYETGSVAFDGSLGTLDAVGNTIDVEIVDDEIEVTEEAEAAMFTIDVEAGSILSSSGFYIGVTSNSNGLKQNASSIYSHTFSIADGVAVIAAAFEGSNMKLRYNKASNQDRFRFYSNGQEAIQLYKRVGGAAHFIPWVLSGIEITTPPTKTSYVVGETFDAAGMVVTAHLVDADNSSNTKDVVVSDYTFNPSAVLAYSDTQITVSYTYKGVTKTAVQEITVSSNYDFETVAELNDLVISTSDEYSGYLTDAVVSFVPATNTAIVKDATGSIMFYKSNHGLKQGQTYTGAISVTAIKYNSLFSEVTTWNATFTGSQTVVAPESVSLADLIDDYDTYQNAYVQVAGLTVVSISDKNINVTDGTNSYVVYDNTSSISVDPGDVITAVGTITKYSTTEEIKVWKAADVTVTASAPKAITFSQPSAGGSFTVSVAGSSITSGTTVAFGTTVTLTATAASGYTFDGWTVNGATVTDASASTATFTMGTSAVTVAASFKQEGGTSGTLTVDFESAETSYSDWSFSNMTTQQTNSNVSAHGGSYFGTTGGKTSATLTTKNKIANPASITFYISKASTNSTASTWRVRVSSDNSNWTNVGDDQSASAGITRGTWYEVTRDLSSYSNVYVQIQYDGTTAVRTIDDVTLSYN